MDMHAIPLDIEAQGSGREVTSYHGQFDAESKSRKERVDVATPRPLNRGRRRRSTRSTERENDYKAQESIRRPRESSNKRDQASQR